MKQVNQLDYIKEFLVKINSEFPRIKFRCEYNSQNFTYIIEVVPLLDFQNNERYLDMEYEFTEAFEKRFLGYILLFVSIDSMTKVTRPVLKIGHCEFDFELEKTGQNFELEYDNTYNDDNKFVFAA